MFWSQMGASWGYVLSTQLSRVTGSDCLADVEMSLEGMN